MPGALTSVQDNGRYGYMASGIGPGGVMDRESAAAANRAVGNDPDCAVLEMTLQGPELEFTEDLVIAAAGADMDAHLDGMPMPSAVPVMARSGSRLVFHAAIKGCRTYLAVRGGIDVPVVLGSRSTNFRCHMGGYRGRPLQAGDELPVIRAAEPFTGQVWDPSMSYHAIRPQYHCDCPQNVTVHVIAGPQQDMFTEAGLETFYHTAYRMTPESDRMGMRLDGEAIGSRNGVDIVSDGIVFGSVQVPRSGLPIILMADHQTTGGYAKIAVVCSFDLPLLAQLSPGAVIRFVKISVEEAQEIDRNPDRMRKNAFQAVFSGRKGADPGSARTERMLRKVRWMYGADRWIQ